MCWNVSYNDSDEDLHTDHIFYPECCHSIQPINLKPKENCPSQANTAAASHLPAAWQWRMASLIGNRECGSEQTWGGNTESLIALGLPSLLSLSGVHRTCLDSQENSEFQRDRNDKQRCLSTNVQNGPKMALNDKWLLLVSLFGKMKSSALISV